MRAAHDYPFFPRGARSFCNANLTAYVPKVPLSHRRYNASSLRTSVGLPSKLSVTPRLLLEEDTGILVVSGKPYLGPPARIGPRQPRSSALTRRFVQFLRKFCTRSTCQDNNKKEEKKKSVCKKDGDGSLGEVPRSMCDRRCFSLILQNLPSSELAGFFSW